MNKIKDIVLRKKSGDMGVYLHCIKDDKLICEYIENGMLLSKKSIICDYSVIAFDACITEDDIVHIVASDIDGNVIYFENQNGEWNQTILISHTPDIKATFENFCFVKNNNSLSVLYTVKQSKMCILFRHYINNPSPSPEYICELSDSNNPPYFDLSLSDEVMIICSEKQSNNIGIKILNIIQEKWSGFHPIIERQTVSDFCVVNTEKKIYFCYKSGNELKESSVEKNMLFSSEKRITLKDKTLTKRHDINCSSPTIRRDGEIIKLFWKRGSSVFSTETNINTENWQRLTEKNFNGVELKLCKMSDYTGITEFEFIYISGNNMNFYSNTAFFRRIQDKKNTATVYDTFKNRNEIEREKAEIMRRMGIRQNDDTFDNISEAELLSSEPHKFSSSDNQQSLIKKRTFEEITVELNKINEKLSYLNKNLSKYIAIITAKDNKKSQKRNKNTFLLKVHKK